MCRKATTRDVKCWINSLAISLSAEGGNLVNAKSLYDCIKLSALLTFQLDLPPLPRANNSAIGAGVIMTMNRFGNSVNFYQSVMTTAGNKLLRVFLNKNLGWLITL